MWNSEPEFEFKITISPGLKEGLAFSNDWIVIFSH